MVDPNDIIANVMQQMVLWGGISLVVTVVLIALIWRMARRMVSPHGEMKNAVMGQATVLDVQDTGTRLNNNPYIALTLDVAHPDGSHYQTETKTVVSIVQLPRLQPGAMIAVKIDAANKTKVAVA